MKPAWTSEAGTGAPCPVCKKFVSLLFKRFQLYEVNCRKIVVRTWPISSPLRSRMQTMPAIALAIIHLIFKISCIKSLHCIPKCRSQFYLSLREYCAPALQRQHTTWGTVQGLITLSPSSVPPHIEHVLGPSSTRSK